ncbi:unnamed protein product [Commensalibacter communis]|uniref:HEPN domain-containing protein n=1 Tax=Commensalibacter communis TaxID=2972786 RepID=UPI0022FFA4C6|nr:HEPN domain-containing protein [Commensalibacter communis]CAI3922472.1 unnamed protein product [Commensalibacter communis]
MQLYELLNELLSLIDLSSFDKAIKSKIFFRPYRDQTSLIVIDQKITEYKKVKNNLIKYFTQNISSNFTEETIDDCIKRNLLSAKINNVLYTIKNQEDFFKNLTSIEPSTMQIITRIEGISLENCQTPIQMGCFEMGYNHDLPEKLGKENFLYLKTNITHIYDYNMPFKKASAYFLDFNRLLLFITKDISHNYNILINNLFCIINNDNLITTQFCEYYLYDLKWNNIAACYHSNSFRPFDMNILLSSSNYTQLNDLWNFYQQIKNNPKSSKITDIQKRILSASLAVGESIRSEDEKNSLIYTCIAIEALFSFDEGQLFQRSITDKLSDCLAFIIGKDLKHRKEIIKFTKEIYKARSALVHGSLSSKNIDFHRMNTLLRDAIIELLNNPKYKSLKTINQLYDMITDAKLSY